MIKTLKQNQSGVDRMTERNFRRWALKMFIKYGPQVTLEELKQKGEIWQG